MEQDKKSLRKFYKEKRYALHKEGLLYEISKKISEKLNKIFEDTKAKHIMLFYPFGSELNILSIMESQKHKDRNFYFPVCNGDKITVCPYKAGDELALNKYKIKEPKTKSIENIEILDIVITPALCADKNFHRLGYGGGYYDRFFSEKKLRAKKIVIIPDDFLIENIPSEAFDIKCDMIITEAKILNSAR